MARQRGWLIGNGRNLNYSMPEVREWYGQNIAHFLQEGVNFWWNDEGETQVQT
jgi:alpha-glucosidase (family GH31 glycosyl hydrolase)